MTALLQACIAQSSSGVYEFRLRPFESIFQTLSFSNIPKDPLSTDHLPMGIMNGNFDDTHEDLFAIARDVLFRYIKSFTCRHHFLIVGAVLLR